MIWNEPQVISVCAPPPPCCNKMGESALPLTRRLIGTGFVFGLSARSCPFPWGTITRSPLASGVTCLAPSSLSQAPPRSMTWKRAYPSAGRLNAQGADISLQQNTDARGFSISNTSVSASGLSRLTTTPISDLLQFRTIGQEIRCLRHSHPRLYRYYKHRSIEGNENNRQ